MEDTIDIRRYLALGLKWWWLIVLATVFGAGIGYWNSQRQPAVYQATTTVIVGQSIQSTDVSTRDIFLSERLALTYAEMALRQPVLQDVVERLSLPDSWQSLRSRVRVNQVPETQLLEITVQAESLEEARVTADEVANQLIQLSPTALENQQQSENRRMVQERLNSLQTKIEAGQQRLAELNKMMNGTLSATQVQEIQGEINNLEQLITNWEDTHTRLLIFIEGERSPNYLAVIEPAQGSSRPVQPKPFQDGLLAGVVGLMLALGVIFLIEFLDDTLKTSDELSQTLGLTSLGAISQIKGQGYYERLITHKEPFSPISETYRLIRSNIQFMSVDHPVKSLVITSAAPGEGKSTTAANLAVVMAQAGLKTIIIDADLRKPVQHDIFQVPNLGGLTGLLTSAESNLDGHLHPTQIDNLSIIPSGVIPPNPSELLGSQRMARLIKELEDAADIVIFDSPPSLIVADAPALSNRVDGTILVTQAGATRLGAIRQAIAHLQQAGATLLGGVLNQISGKEGGYYQQYYAAYTSDNGRGPAATQPANRKPRRRWPLLPFLKTSRY